MTSYKVPEAFDNKLQVLAKDSTNPATNKEDVITRAVALYEYLHLQIQNTSNKVAILDDQDQVIQIIDPLP